MNIADILAETAYPLTPDQLNPNARIDLGLLYRGVEGGTDARQALRHFTGGDIGDGIYFSPNEGIAASYGGGPRSSIRAGTRVVHTYRVQPLYPDDLVYVFGGYRHGEPVRLFSGNGIDLWDGPYVVAEIEQALKRIGPRIVVGTPKSVGLNQVCVRDPSVVAPIDRIGEARKESDLVRPTHYGQWGASHANSQTISGEAARIMNDVPPGYRVEPEVNKRGNRLAFAFLDAIAKSRGSPEPLYHGFNNHRQIDWQIGQKLTLPLTAAIGEIDGSVGYGSRGSDTNPTVFAFPAGTPFAGYAKWGKSDARDFGYTWSEAIVAGRFVVTGIRDKQRQYGWSDMPEYTVVELQPKEIFDPRTGAWRAL